MKTALIIILVIVAIFSVLFTIAWCKINSQLSREEEARMWLQQKEDLDESENSEEE